jgi:serine/threonine protein kinase
MARAKQLDVNSQIIELGEGRQIRLLDAIGKGSTATVHRGVLASPVVGAGAGSVLERRVAVKLFSSLATDDCEVILAALVRTTRRLSCVAHPNVAQVYECGVWRGRPFILSELVPGVSLGKLIATYAEKKQRLPLDVALFISAEIGEALAGARLARDLKGVQLAMVHHSVSPHQVMLSWRGEVKVTDFETSTARPAGSSVRSLRGVAARATFMAPEVAQGREADARSDVFSFGILLRELLIGPRFPESLSDAEAIGLAREGYVKPLTFQPHLPAGVVSIVDRALEIDPDLRYPNACAMAFDLRREAFAMGVGDGRYFLRRVLEREWTEYADEVTAEHKFRSPALEGSLDDLHVLPLKRRR